MYVVIMSQQQDGFPPIIRETEITKASKEEAFRICRDLEERCGHMCIVARVEIEDESKFRSLLMEYVEKVSRIKKELSSFYRSQHAGQGVYKNKSATVGDCQEKN